MISGVFRELHKGAIAATSSMLNGLTRAIRTLFALGATGTPPVIKGARILYVEKCVREKRTNSGGTAGDSALVPNGARAFCYLNYRFSVGNFVLWVLETNFSSDGS